MRSFEGLNNRQKKTNLRFGVVFIFVVLIYVYFALSAPNRDELITVNGKLESIECLLTSRDFSIYGQVKLKQMEGQIQEFKFNKKCRKNTFDGIAGSDVTVLYDKSERSPRVYELVIGDATLINYKDTVFGMYKNVIFVAFFVGLSWLVWFFVQVIRS